jgi:gliding motility-associated protein GldM
MAGGKLTPRQKMINLMYLVFIAMLAMNMSKEVLSAFGLMNERFEASNKNSESVNDQMLASLDQKASEDSHFKEASALGHQAKEICDNFYKYVGSLKADVLKGVETDQKTGKLPYEAMDKGDNIDNLWFQGDGYSKKGKEIIEKVNKYKADLAALLKDSKYKSILSEVNDKFNTDDVKDKEGLKVKFLEYHFEKFPGIASLAKLSAWQNDAKKTEADIYSSLLGKAAVAAASMSNFQAIVALEKNVYFEGEPVKGKVVLGKYDADTKPTGFSGPGRIENGQAIIAMTAGSVGEHDLGGTFTFVEDGKTIPIPFKGSYVVVPRPNTANISADKMNVVYRGLPNPMTISFAGIPDNKVTASAPGLSPAGGKGKYNLNPGAGTEVTVTATGTMTDGRAVSDKKLFRIKGIPAPQAAIGGAAGTQKGAKSRLQSSQITAVLPDFLYDLKFQVTQFVFKVPGQASIVVNGDRVNGQCVSALARASKGDQITISDVKTKIVGEGSGIQTKTAAPAIYELQ